MTEDFPFTKEELSDKELTTEPIDDQILYAVYNSHYRREQIIDVTTFGADWTGDIIDDMVDEGKLVRGNDEVGLFYMLSEEQRPSKYGLDPEEREEIHERALEEYKYEGIVGDEEDIKAVAETSSSEKSHAEAASAMESGPDTGIEPTELTAGEPPEWYQQMAEHEEDLPHPLPAWEDIQRTRSKHGGRLPVARDYDWNEEKLDSEKVEEFVEAETEYTDMKKEIEERRTIGKLPHFRICGPTGCGKTLAGENIAVDMDAPCFIINCHDGLRPNNLLGMPTYVGDETWWVDGPIVKAMLASNDRNVTIIFDEVNRTTSRTLGVIMSVLDHQCRITLNARGGEVVEGDPMNLITFATMNEGRGYQVNRLDPAQIRRLGNTFETDYIGMYDVGEEADLIVDRTPVDEDVATKLVEAANDIRQKANGDSAVRMGVPTSAMLDWARTAWVYRDDDPDGGPLVKAAHRSVVNPFFRDSTEERDTVTNIVETHLMDHPVYEREPEVDTVPDASEVDTSEPDRKDPEDIEVGDDAWLMCEDCGWYEKSEEASEEVVTTMSCPECDSMVIPKDM